MYRIGTSGYYFKDWIGSVYPEKIKKSELLPYYEKELGFNSLEINYTYYHLPDWKTISGMERKTSDNFTFVVKAYKDMTHNIKRNEKMELEANREVFEKFANALKPLIENGKLGGVLAQFPYSFKANRENAKYIVVFKELLGDMPLYVEFRNIDWIKKEVFDFLKKRGIGYCCVDEPRLKGLVPFVSVSTSENGYVRLHGRNKNWFKANVSERYNYNYSEDELIDIAEKVSKINRNAKDVYIFFNNCHLGFAAKNAIKMKELLNEKNN